MNDFDETSAFLFYRGNDGTVKVQIFVEDESVWTTQKGMADIFGVDRVTITEHIQNVFQSGELQEDSVCRKIRHTAADGKPYLTNFYNLDMIISVGYRVNSYQATQFRVWSTKVLKEYLTKGFALDDERLKQGKQLFGKDYFDELLERIREIRASERRFYQKVTDLYALSIDYDKNAPVTHTFFASVQNKLEYAITGHTASELLKLRANSNSPNMGLTSWKNEPTGGKIVKSDVSVAKNYLKEDEIKDLNLIVNMYIDYAESQAKRHKAFKMDEWADKLDAFLQFNEYRILDDAGHIRADAAQRFAEKEYAKFRVIQDKNYESDFDKISVKIRETSQLPGESNQATKKNLHGKFDRQVKGLLKVPPPPKIEDEIKDEPDPNA